MRFEHNPDLNPDLAALARKTVYASIALFVLCVIWETLGAPLKSGGYWLALKGVLFLPLLPKLWRGERYSYQVFSLLSLLYVLEGLMRVYSDPAPSYYFAMVETILAVLIFVWVNQFAFKTKAPRPAKVKKTRKMSGLLYVALIIFAVNLTLPSPDSAFLNADDGTYIQFKTILNWITLGIVVPYLIIIAYYRIKSSRSQPE